MKQLLVKTAAVIGACTLAFTIGGCSSGSSSTKGDEAKGKSQSTSKEQKPAETKKPEPVLPKFTVDQLKSKWEGKTFAGEKLEYIDMTNPYIVKAQSESLDKLKKAKVDPAECKPLVAGASGDVNMETEGKKIALFVNPKGKVIGLGYNTDPNPDIAKGVEMIAKLKDKCSDITVEDKIKIHSEISELSEFASIAKTGYVAASSAAGGKVQYSFQLLLKNGQYLYVTANDKAAGEQAIKDAIKYLGIEG